MNVKIDLLKSFLEYGLVTVFEIVRSVSCIASCNQPVTVERNFTIDGNANTQRLYINRALVFTRLNDFCVNDFCSHVAAPSQHVIIFALNLNLY